MTNTVRTAPNLQRTLLAQMIRCQIGQGFNTQKVPRGTFYSSSVTYKEACKCVNTVAYQTSFFSDALTELKLG